ncbi:uncharacterized protein K02A2.6-like [Eriocheir sinensis]|uniref:uncharacterized protein K02A2.6-like n=1 Tax=Eriocheir sinensis TaxID=95602 RepID=UPI0021C92370|nr:uncharacterized protein K02A2.6-like [Eriocheir sinensis]
MTDTRFTYSTLRRFLARWGVEHRVTSPYNPRTNGHPEAAVKIVKKLISTTIMDGRLNCDDFARGLLELRNTPRANGRSPAQRRPLAAPPDKDNIPAPLRRSARQQREPQRLTVRWDSQTYDGDASSDDRDS